jgi:hypothetical protein
MNYVAYVAFSVPTGTTLYTIQLLWQSNLNFHFKFESQINDKENIKFSMLKYFSLTYPSIYL